jgi:hypothetical protein
MILKIAACVGVAFIAFVLWRLASVARGASARDQQLLRRLDPLAARFDRKEQVPPEEIRAICAAPELRSMLYAMLGHYQALNLFPKEYLSQVSQAEATLVYWMLHPNELRAAPSAIEPLESMGRTISGKPATFYVFRYRMPEGHWAGSNWLLGLSGPFFAEDKPYEAAAGGFSRAGDVVGKIAPAELVDWYIGILRQQGLIENKTD